MPKNIFVKYVGQKKVLHVPFGYNNQFPLKSMSELEETIDFPRNQMVELSPERAEILLKFSPAIFKMEGTIRPKATTIRGNMPKAPSVAVPLTQEEYEDVTGDTDSALEDSGPQDVDEGVRAAV